MMLLLLLLQPLAAYFGGVVAQEVVKATGKYTPLEQWLHLDFLEVLPDTPPSQADSAPRGGRYDDLVAVFGEPFVAQQLMNGRTFMVGCGALGCEFLKVSDRSKQST
jgi:ubiquitin-activating enzyme E1